MTTIKKLTKKELKAIEIMNAKNELRAIFEKQGTTVFTETLHVSRSGMLRSIKVFTNQYDDITDLVATVDGYSFHKSGGLKVNGCGMDMGFSVVYNLSCSLYCEHGYQHDNAYKLNQRWI